MPHEEFDRVDALTHLPGGLIDDIQVIQRIVGTDDLTQVRAETPDEAVILFSFGHEIL